MSAIPVIMDVDTGTDDALALAYAVQSPKLDLLAATSVAGNVGVERATANTLAVLDWLGAVDVPVHRGASRPLVRPHLDAAGFHHEGGLGGAKLPASRRALGADRGPAAIIRLAHARPGEITLIALGPLTNVAIALNVEPRLPELLKGVVLMGGAFTVPGNTHPDGSFGRAGEPDPAAEFNIIADPEAAEQVFAAPFKHLTAIGLDVTNQVALTNEDWDAVNSGSNLGPSAALLREVGGHAFGTLAREQFSLHDPLATAVAADPELVATETAGVVVECDGPSVGQTRIAGPGAVQVALRVDSERALDEFRRTLGLPTAR
jgi:inosine-uridine nucleoside N-ribohydrolase